MPLVRVCAAVMGSVRSWRTWRAAKASYLRLDMLKTGRYLVRLGKIRFSHSARMNYQRVLRGSLAVPMRHHLTTVPHARLGTDGAGGWLFLAPSGQTDRQGTSFPTSLFRSGTSEEAEGAVGVTRATSHRDGRQSSEVVCAPLE